MSTTGASGGVDVRAEGPSRRLQERETWLMPKRKKRSGYTGPSGVLDTSVKGHGAQNVRIQAIDAHGEDPNRSGQDGEPRLGWSRKKSRHYRAPSKFPNDSAKKHSVAVQTDDRVGVEKVQGRAGRYQSSMDALLQAAIRPSDLPNESAIMHSVAVKPDGRIAVEQVEGDTGRYRSSMDALLEAAFGPSDLPNDFANNVDRRHVEADKLSAEQVRGGSARDSTACGTTKTRVDDDERIGLNTVHRSGPGNQEESVQEHPHSARKKPCVCGRDGHIAGTAYIHSHAHSEARRKNSHAAECSMGSLFLNWPKFFVSETRAKVEDYFRTDTPNAGNAKLSDQLKVVVAATRSGPDDDFQKMRGTKLPLGRKKRSKVEPAKTVPSIRLGAGCAIYRQSLTMCKKSL